MQNSRLTSVHGFTLVELMIVVVIVAIFAAIAIPSYQEYVRRAIAAQAQQEMQRISTELERSKTRNFNYLGFPSTVVLPVGATGSAVQYTITVSDGADVSKSLTDSTASGQSWVMQGIWKTSETTNVDNFSFLMTSSGVRCKNKTKANITATNVDNATCGTGREEW
ncbi:prepilin-type N-terminal cleavage/methylation domain-containing protein [Acinetobacter suaedae]|uniref:Prepilin-type N-terminal cleavage/methylation domain-containing protein n=1 Tax=Acinetobacter suaedae TaxID=2609668 RepID=A0A5P1UNZ5_9GAMM|nr:type IV pilin protein [Acinetobacter sp. C16S1]QER38445.1 prepilin-type N-terminal cleavage/methylation domain-containing protein [Acinetobacter sp. C16S1]